MRLGDENERVRFGPRVMTLTLIAAALVSAYIVASIFVVPPTLAADFNFINERGSITALSAFFFAAGCGFAFVSLFLAPSGERDAQFLWLVVFVVMGFLALDELLEFHERIGKSLDQLVSLSTLSAGAIRHWNDVIVVLYGVAAIPVGLILLPAIARYRAFLMMIAIAFLMYAIHTVVDSVTEPPTYFSVIVEESAKLYCSMCISLACLFGLFVQVGLSAKPTAVATA